MKVEQFLPFLVDFQTQIKTPTCEEAEFWWGSYLYSLYKSGQKAEPLEIQVNALEQVRAIQKPKPYGAATYLVIAPLPGILVSDDLVSRRPLLSKPYDVFGDMLRLKDVAELYLSIDVHQPDWYVHTMITLIQATISSEFDSADFSETLQEYSLYRREAYA